MSTPDPFHIRHEHCSQCSHCFPDIGPDPLQRQVHPGDAAGLLGHALARLRAATDLQQTGVPDQTLLAWRIDVQRMLSEYYRLDTLARLLREENERLRQPLIGAMMVANEQTNLKATVQR